MATRIHTDRVRFDLFAPHIHSGIQYEAGQIEITHADAVKLEARGFGKIIKRQRRTATPAVPAETED